MMAKTPSLNASIRVVGIWPTLKSLCIRPKVLLLLPDSTANNIIALGFSSAGTECVGPRVSIAGSTASMFERRREHRGFPLLMRRLILLDRCLS